MTRKTIGAFLLALLFGLCTDISATTYGKEKKGLKGRYLVVDDGVDTSKYGGAIVILEPTLVEFDKDRPVDNETIRDAADDMLRERLTGLKNAGLFDSIVSSTPLELPIDKPILRLQPEIQIQHGSQAMRVFVGMGAGKSKTHIRVEIFDARSGEHIGYFNGYGSGSGAWTFTGGDTSRMAQDDFEESFNLFAEYLQQAIPKTPAVSKTPVVSNTPAAPGAIY
jgi:hypothetical protein